MDVLLIPLFHLLISLISLYTWAVISMVIINWLTALGIVDGYNRFVFVISTFLFKITEPPLRFIRRFLPNFNGIDLSPLVLILSLWFLQEVLSRIAMKLI